MAAGVARAAVLAQIPFQYRDGFLWLKVTAAGRSEPLNFLLDSGAASSVVSTQAARSLHLRLGMSQEVAGVYSHTAASWISHFEASVGGMALPQSVLALDLHAVSATCHQPIDGLVGADFFHGRIVQIDFAAGCIRILNATASGQGATVLPMQTRNHAICLPVAVAGGTAQWMRLDTGCDSCLEWAPGRGTQSGNAQSTSVGLSSGSGQTMYTDVHLGDRSLHAVKTGKHGAQIFPGESGLVGNALLCKFRVTVDSVHHQVILE
jgi:hypothetical protein